MKKISVIIPVYNSERYLVRCIETIINQTYYNLEIILIDDGSTDNSLKICNEYSLKDDRIKVLHKENNGAASARNAGLDCATGDYIAFVDSDDYINLEMYEEMMKVSQQYDCDIVMCDCFKEKGKESKIFTHSICSGFYDKNRLIIEYFPSLLITNSVEYPPTISNWVCLFKRSLIEENNIRYKEDMRFSEDWLFGSQAMYFANRFYYMKGDCFYHYIENANSVTHLYYADKWPIMSKLYLYIKDFFGNIDDFDFNRQIDMSLLFIVYHCISNIKNSSLTARDKKHYIKNIVNDKNVRYMFKRIKINELNITMKLKIMTLIYKYKLILFILLK